jgi:hypothetical protein
MIMDLDLVERSFYISLIYLVDTRVILQRYEGPWVVYRLEWYHEQN